MVQRKVASKLGIQADHVKSEKRLANLKTSSSSQHQDGRNRGGTEMKKKMKKSRSIKLSDIESLRSSSSPLKRNISQPGKPPPPPPAHDVPAGAAIPQKQSTMKTPDWSPNYMKSTSSFEARKERTQVSSSRTTPQTGSDSKNSRRKNQKLSKLESVSGHKPAAKLTKTSSLKLVRTLTKTPSFKPARSSAKKCSQVALCADIDAQRATCSSTLKGSKFPAYLMLSPGATESEGTSVMKVCPYTYCSLNDHCHAPLPPLKCFLSARRRLLKTQKSMKLEALFPLKAKPSGDGTKEIDSERVIIDEKPAFQEDFGSSAISPLVQEGGVDFFIEIYANDKEDTAETTGSSTDEVDGEKITDIAEKMDDLNDFMSSVGGGNETAEQDNGQVAESLSDGSSLSEIDFKDNLDQNNDITLREMDITATFVEEQKMEDADEDNPPTFAQEDTTLGCFCNGSDSEGECSASIELDDEYISEASDMEWEEGQLSTSNLDNEADDATQTDDEANLNVGYQSGIENPDLHDKSIFKSDDTVSNCFEEILADEVLQEVYEEESVSFEEKFGKDDSGSDGTDENLESEESSQASESQSHDQISSTEDALEELTAEENDRSAETDDLTSLVITSASMEEPTEETTEAREEKNAVCNAENDLLDADSQLGDDETNCTTDVADEALIDQQENDICQDDDANALVGNQITNSSQDFTEISTLCEEASDKSLLSKIEDPETAQNVATRDFSQEQQFYNTDVGDGMEEKDQVDYAKSLVGIHYSDSSQGCSEAEKENTEEENNKSSKMMEACQDATAIVKDSELSQDFIDGSLSSEIQCYASDEKFQNGNIVEDQSHSEEDHSEVEKFKNSSFMDSEEQSDSEMNKCTLAKSTVGEVAKMDVEDNTVPDAANTCVTANTMTSQETENASFHAGINIKQELHNACNYSKGKIRCKRTIKECEEPRKFNPRDPNYLPVEPDPEAEKVDLKHQMMDDRKNAEEWMVDYALRQAVTKLAPARKRRVALLVEAFETVTPIPKYETHLRHTSASFAHVRPIQACS
ncbi:hypothetical protein L1049_012363 [Liquidambar formosana]|uniref:Calmodulin-binding domain-containing protein n=1 Tax=Liquidambar formosana TaxID=63359 RepID=A0AAP0RYY0_LIQFO